jgi:hypothetical protein
MIHKMTAEQRLAQLEEEVRGLKQRLTPEAPIELDEDEAAYQRLKPSIDKDYPASRFVAIHGGKIVGDAASFEELLKALRRDGYEPKDSFVVEAGVDYPEYGVILGLESRKS